MTRQQATILTLIVIAALLRVAGIFDDFWLDEIWSYYIARGLHNPLDVLLSTAARIDNNHPLNTLLIWLMGDQPNWPIYRLPSLAAGIGSVILATIIAQRRGNQSAILAAILVGFSYPLIHYSSEARGYSMGIFFALLGFDALERYLLKPTVSRAILFSIACALGFLSHITFIHFYAGAFAWSVFHLIRGEKPQIAVKRMLELHAVPLASFAVIYFAFISKLTLGGSPPQPLGEALSESIARLVAFGGPPTLNWTFFIAAIAGVIALIVAHARRGSDVWIFLLVTLLISPAIIVTRQVVIAERWQPILPRYFVILLPFAMLGVSFLASNWMTRWNIRCSFLCLLIFFLVSNLWRTARFLQIGRGHYSDAVEYMGQQTNGPVITILADNSLRVAMPLDFYSRLLPPSKTLLVHSMDQSDDATRFPNLPQWVVLSSNLRGAPPPSPGPQYAFDREFSYFGLSGYCWYVYRLQSTPPSPREGRGPG